MIANERSEHWRYLFSIAYRMLGSVQEAEDAVQEAYLRYVEASPDEIRSERAYLATLVTRISIDRLRSAARNRETYFGPWLPEPIAGDPSEQLEDPDSLSMAFLVVLESLTPVERAVFLLREVFGYQHREIASIVQRTEGNVRQIAHRAREAIEARRPRFSIPQDRRREIGVRFVDALRRLDVQAMLELFADDVTLRADGGGVVSAAPRPVVGADRVTRLIIGVSRPDFVPVEADINGRPGLLINVGGEVFAAVSYEIRDDRIGDIFVVMNPEKLAGLTAGGEA